jgi:hypothetical protein
MKETDAVAGTTRPCMAVLADERGQARRSPPVVAPRPLGSVSAGERDRGWRVIIPRCLPGGPALAGEGGVSCGF